NTIVLGAEADVSFGSFSGMTHEPGLGINHYVSTLDYFGTVRARLGWDLGRFLPYVTSGPAWGRNKVVIVGPDEEEHGLLRTHWGWAVGAGFEYAVDAHWSLRGEYLYAGFDRRSYGRLFFGDAGEALASFRPDISALRLGL